MEQRKNEVEESSLHLDELSVPQKPSLKRPIRKPFQQYCNEKGSIVWYTPYFEVQRKFYFEVITFHVNTNLHFSLVETKVFQHFVSGVNPKYNIKSSHTMSNKIDALLFKSWKRLYMRS